MNVNVTVTREEIDQAKKLLDLLRQWEPIRKATNHYDGGVVTVQMTGNTKGKVEVNINRAWGYRSSPDMDSFGKAEVEIRSLVGSTIEKLAVDVCKIIEKHIPIQLGESDKK